MMPAKARTARSIVMAILLSVRSIDARWPRAQRTMASAFIAPAVCARTLPLRNRYIAGMPRTPSRAETFGASSAFSLSSRTCGSSAAAARSNGGCHGAARAAPRRPDVQQHRDAVGADVPLEARLVHLDRMRVEQRLVADAAACRVRRRVRLARGSPCRSAGRRCVRRRAWRPSQLRLLSASAMSSRRSTKLS